jgi:Ca2+-dependent lipid-binding protein
LTFAIVQPHVDFGLKLIGADLMSIPGLYRFVQVHDNVPSAIPHL